MKRSFYVAVLAAALTLASAGSRGAGAATETYKRTLSRAKYARPPSIPFPVGNRFSTDREILGRTLFFDPRMSGSGGTSCATCHNPGLSWGDGLPKAVGRGMKELNRRTPTILNSAWAELLFWDGRAESLEEQALVPVASAEEMNEPLDRMVEMVAGIAGYRAMFARAYPGEAISSKTVARAIATFERTVVSARAPFDDCVAGAESAISEPAKRGFDLFNTKATCAKCHEGWNFTDNGFHDIGLSDGDMGRGALLPLEAMRHAFKTPTLRNADRRRPYMHNGSERSLEDVIELYDRGGRKKRPSLSEEIVPLHLTAREKADLVTFLKTLTGEDKRIEAPTFPR